MKKYSLLSIILLLNMTPVYGQTPKAKSSDLLRHNAASSTKISDLVINADKMTQIKSKNLIELSGQVQLVFKKNYLSADHVDINTKKETLLAKGNVVLQSQNKKATADELFINYKTMIGTLKKASITSGKVSFSGKKIQKLSNKNYLIEDATFTSCHNCPPSWSFSGSKIDAEIGNRAYIKSPIFRIMGFPILPLPPLSLPLNTLRQSGFLIPSLEGGSKNGLAYSQSYFLTLGNSQDITLTAKKFQKNGLKGLFEYRNQLGVDSSLQFNTGFIYDKTFSLLDEGKERRERGFIKYKNRIHFLDYYTQRTSLQRFSDLHYIRDFSEAPNSKKEVFQPGKSAIENKISISRSTPSTFSSLEATFHTSLLKESPFAKNNDSVHRLPKFRYSIIEQEIAKTGLNSSFNLNYTHFYRASSDYDNICLSGELCNGEIVPDGERRFNPEEDGVFNPERDLIRTGQRLKIDTTLSRSFLIGHSLNVLPSLTYVHKQYRFNSPPLPKGQQFSNNEGQKYLLANLSLQTQLTHVYGLEHIKHASLYKHIIEPEIQFTSIPWSNLSQHSFFGNSQKQSYSNRLEELTDSDFFNPNSSLQFDYEDHHFNTQLIGYSLTNKIIQKYWRSGVPKYQDLLIFRISQSYDLKERKQPEPKPWSTLNGQLQVNLKSFELFNVSSYHPYTAFFENYTRLKLSNNVGNFFQIAYSENVKLDENNQKDPNTKSKQTELGIGYSGVTFNFLGQISYSFHDQNIRYWQTTFGYRPPGECWELGVNVQKQVNRDEIDYKGVLKFDFGQ